MSGTGDRSKKAGAPAEGSIASGIGSRQTRPQGVLQKRVPSAAPPPPGGEGGCGALPPGSDRASDPAGLAAPVDTPTAGLHWKFTADPRTGETRMLRAPDAPPLDAVNLLHRLLLGGSPYVELAAKVSRQLPSTAMEYMEEHLARMAPQNPAEQVLATQILVQHARVAWLVKQCCYATDPELRCRLDRAVDSAMNMSRRQVLAWQQLRSPRPVQYIAGQQVNVAGQQIVANGVAPSTLRTGETIAANEQGCSHVNGWRSTEALKGIPPLGRWPCLAAGGGGGEQALEPLDRTANTGGEGPSRAERAAPRPASRGKRRAPTGHA